MKLILCLFFAVQMVVGKTLLNDGICRRSDSNLNSCLMNQTGKVIKQLQNGVPEYNMESIDPLEMEFMTVEGELENFKIKMAMSNITMYGHGDIKLHEIKFDPESLTGEISSTIPILTMTCDYLATGKLFSIPLESNAHFYGNFSEMGLQLYFRLKTVQRKGVEFFSVDKLTGKLSLGGSYTKLDSIDPARQPQAQLIQDFYNDNVKLIVKTVNPVGNEYTGYFYKYIFERYLRKIPAFELLPQ